MRISYRSLYLFLFCFTLGSLFALLHWRYALAFLAGAVFRAAWRFALIADCRRLCRLHRREKEPGLNPDDYFPVIET